MPNNCFCDQRGIGDPTQTCGDCPEDYLERDNGGMMNDKNLDSGPSADTAFPIGGEPLPAIHKKRDGFLLIRTDGSCRYLGFRESLAYRLFRRIPNV